MYFFSAIRTSDIPKYCKMIHFRAIGNKKRLKAEHDTGLPHNEIKMSYRKNTSGATSTLSSSSSTKTKKALSFASNNRFSFKKTTLDKFSFFATCSAFVWFVFHLYKITMMASTHSDMSHYLSQDAIRSSANAVFKRTPLIQDQHRNKKVIHKNAGIRGVTSLTGVSIIHENRLVGKVKNKVTGMEKTSLYYQEGAALSCKDPKRLMPLCESCIPGLVENVKTKECELGNATKSIRSQLFHIASQRGAKGTCQVYKYLSTETLQQRHKYAGKILDALAPRRVLDIGSYTSPIVSFMSSCPDTVYMIEPCGELSNKFGSEPWLSKQIRCDTRAPMHDTNATSSDMISGEIGDAPNMTHHMVAPTSIKTFLHTRHFQHFDAVVCIGCDVNFGPTWDELMSMPRPFHLVLEFSQLAFAKDYPIEDKSGCTLIRSHDFDFSDCPDCEYNIRKSMSQYGKQRKLIVFHCKEYPQDKVREVWARRNLSQYCKKVGNETYFDIACKSENILFDPNISDNALMAIDAMHENEKTDMDVLSQQMIDQQKV
jgi:hypothetical protein